MGARALALPLDTEQTATTIAATPDPPPPLAVLHHGAEAGGLRGPWCDEVHLRDCVAGDAVAAPVAVEVELAKDRVRVVRAVETDLHVERDAHPVARLEVELAGH